MSSGPAQINPLTDFSGFDATTISRAGSFNLGISPDHALPLFSAPGEAFWAPGWEPFILHGDGYEEGTVWVTSTDGRTTYWYVADYDTVKRHAQYVRVTPGASAGTVDVQVASNGRGGCTINVAYRLTGLSLAGNSDLENTFRESDYAAMMEEWRRAIENSRDGIDRFLQSQGRPGGQ